MNEEKGEENRKNGQGTLQKFVISKKQIEEIINLYCC